MWEVDAGEVSILRPMDTSALFGGFELLLHDLTALI